MNGGRVLRCAGDPLWPPQDVGTGVCRKSSSCPSWRGPKQKEIREQDEARRSAPTLEGISEALVEW
jgi:hypothetical protein